MSYTALQRLVHLSRATIAGALRTLEDLGVLTRIKRRLSIVWHQGGTATRQATSAYVLHPPTPGHTEFSERTVIQTVEILSSVPARAAQAAVAALAARRKEMAERLLRTAARQ